MKKKSNNEKLNEKKDKTKTGKESEFNNLEFITINATNQTDKKCQKFYEPINLKKFYKIKKIIHLKEVLKQLKYSILNLIKK